MTRMLLETGEHEILEACRRGEREAFRALFEAYKDHVYSIALRFTGDESLAMDIAQDTFLKLFSSLREFRGEAQFATFVYRMVVNACLDYKRRAWRLAPLADGLVAMLRAPGDSLRSLLDDEMRERVRAAVETLSPDMRMVVVLRYTEGLAYEEIAEVMGCSAGTVASRLNRAHKALERKLSHV